MKENERKKIDEFSQAGEEISISVMIRVYGRRICLLIKVKVVRIEPKKQNCQ